MGTFCFFAREERANPDRREAKKQNASILLARRKSGIILLAAILFLWNLWATDPWAPDEPYFAEGAREMVADGQWAVPHVNGVVTTDKPPLFFWLIALFSLPFGGVSSLTARLPSALAALGTVALTMRLGRRLAGEDTGVLAGALLTTTYLVWDKARSAQIDSLLCLLILVALSAFEAYRAGDADGRRAGFLFWLAAALAVLAKGPVGFLLPLGTALVTLAWDGNLRAWRRFAPLSGPLLFAAILAGWMALATLGGHGEYSVWGALKEHALNRALHGLHHRQPPWYYLQVLPVQLLPWSGLVAAALVLAFRRGGPSERLLLAWALFVVGFFSFSTEKRDLYVLPAYPAFLILAAMLARSFLDEPPPLARAWLKVPHALVGISLILAGTGAAVLGRRLEAPPPWTVGALGLVLVATGVASLQAILRGRVASSLKATALGTIAAYLLVASIILPALDPTKSARRFSEIVQTRTAASRQAGHPVLAFGLGNQPEAFAFFTNGVYLRETSDPAVLGAHLDQPSRVYAVVDRAQIDLLPAETRARVVVLASESLSRQEVALIANGPPDTPAQ